MGAVGGMLGLGGGAGGTGFNTQAGTDAQQMNTAYQGNQQAMQNQQALLQALQAQGGLGNQSQVYGQLQGVANGTGPNPAQAMLNQQTGQNVANQAALAAGQRGAGANVGLMSRQAANQGANLQQQAVGQGASLQAQQSLNALTGAGNMANTMAGQQIGQVNANQAAQLGEQNALLGANNANNTVQGSLAQTRMGQQPGAIGGVLNGIAKIPSLLFADGGQVANANASPTGPQSMFGQALMGQSAMASGGNVGDQLKGGGHVPGQAAVKGDSYKNDTVKALLSPGEVVIPKSVMESKNPAKGAADFVMAVMAKKGKRA